ncbi:MAG: AraC family transcriptional regulator [Burkholderiales bacterium]|jgi:AraC-like DNA-binding protein|nr:AraC family transcriptional regulator [Burkholderiales bacterium]
MSSASMPSAHDAALDELLRAASFRSEVFFAGKLCDRWSLDTSGSGKASFHVVASGHCWLHMPGGAAPVRLGEGDVCVFPHDAPHALADRASRDVPFGAKATGTPEPLASPAPGTGLLCGYVDVEPASKALLVAALPDHIVLHAHDPAEGAQARRLLEVLIAEAAVNAAGSRAVLERLCDALFFLVIRAAVRQGTGAIGLLAALRDPQLHAAIAAIAQRPAEPWTIERLADEAHLSRSTFAERFQSVIGHAPIEFLTQWRMLLARRWLEHERLSVLEVAERCGYASEAAFAKAFKRVTGLGPGEVRRIGRR